MPKKVASKSKPAAKKPAPKLVAKKPPAKAKPAPKKAPHKPVAKGAAKPVAKSAVKPTGKPSAKIDPKHSAKLASKVALKPGGVKSVVKGDGKDAAIAPKKAVVPLGKTDVKAPPKKMKPPVQPVMPAGIGRLLDPGNPIRKPLIPSGPKAAHVRPLGSRIAEATDGTPAPIVKTVLTPEQLAEFSELLLRKRQALIKDITGMENEALRGGSGSLSNMPSHLAEQGSEAYDQSLSLDLAAADRKLLREIDDALKRIAAETYGICEHTLKPIKLERLRELPWARYSIEAAREIERQAMRAF